MPLVMEIGNISTLSDKEVEQIKAYIEQGTILDVQFVDASGEVMVPVGIIPEVKNDEGEVTANAYVTVIKNGSIVMDENAVRGHDNKVGNNFVIQNYADLTLENVAVTGNSYTSYVVSNNSGNVAFTGNTSITAVKEGAVAAINGGAFNDDGTTGSYIGSLPIGLTVSGGEINTERMAKVLIDEFRSGKLGRFTLEEPEDA